MTDSKSKEQIAKPEEFKVVTGKLREELTWPRYGEAQAQGRRTYLRARLASLGESHQEDQTKYHGQQEEDRGG